MKKISFSFPVLLLCLLLCRCAPSPSSIGDLPVIDINASYPDDTTVWEDKIASIEYIALETSDEFLCGMGQVIAFDDDIIIYYNYFVLDHVGDILIFDSKGKGLKKINHRGQSSMEYSFVSTLLYDDSSKELLIYDSNLHKIFVYDLAGDFKRVLVCPQYKFEDERKMVRYNEIEVFDDQSLLCYSDSEHADYPFTLISKQTGEKIQDIDLIPYPERIPPFISDGTTVHGTLTKHIVGPHPFLLKHPSSDTIYSFSQDRILKPYLVQSPSVLANDARPNSLFPMLKIGRYLQLKSVIKISAEKKIEESLFWYDSEEKQLFISRPVAGERFSLNEIQHIHASRPNVFMTYEVYFERRKIRPTMDAQLQDVLRQWQDDDNPILKKITFKEYNNDATDD